MQDNGLVFLLGLFGFFFVLWLVGGGPHNQVSKSGIFITPASPDTTQQGYGPKPTVNETVTLPGNGSITVKSNPSADTSTQQVTAHIPSVSIARSTQTSSANPTQAYLEFIVTSHSSSSVDLKGWKFVSTSSGSSASIASDIVLKPDTSVLVVSSFPNTGAHDSMQLVEPNGTVVATTSF